MEDILKKSKVYYGLISIVLLNAFDGIATFIGLKYGFYIELNKFLSIVYDNSPVLFLIIKIVLPTILIIVLLNNVKYELSVITKLIILISNIVYICICIYHVILYGMFILG